MMRSQVENVTLQNIVKSLIRTASSGTEIDDHLFIRAQAQLPQQTRNLVRASPELALRLFGIPYLEQISTDYYFWDNTTLSLKKPLAEQVRNGSRVLEVGPGPAATLSLFLYYCKKNLDIVCAEIYPPFVESARQAVALSKAPIKVVESAMVRNISGRFDVIFMNPPYVKPLVLKEMNISKGTAEDQAGYGGADGSDVVAEFLRDVPGSLAPDGIALLGINNRHLEDEKMMHLIDAAKLRLIRKYYSAEQVPPYSQVYILGHR